MRVNLKRWLAEVGYRLLLHCGCRLYGTSRCYSTANGIYGRVLLAVLGLMHVSGKLGHGAWSKKRL